MLKSITRTIIGYDQFNKIQYATLYLSHEPDFIISVASSFIQDLLTNYIPDMGKNENINMCINNRYVERQRKTISNSIFKYLVVIHDLKPESTTKLVTLP